MNITTGLRILSNPVMALELFHADALRLGFLGAIPAVIYALGCAGSGFWLERLGFRKMIGLAGMIVLLGYGAIVLVDCFWKLFFLTLVVALGASLFWPAMVRWLGEEMPGAQLRRRVGNYNIALIGGIMLGPLLGGILISFNYRLPYLTSAGLIIIVLAVMAVERKNQNISDKEDGTSLVWKEVGDKAEPGFIYIGWAANFAAWFAIGGTQALFPELAKSLPVVIGDRFLGFLFSLVSLGEIVVVIILRKTCRWHYNYRLLFIFQLLGIGGSLILAINKDPVIFIPAFLGIGFTGGMTYFSSIFYSIHKQECKGRKSGFHESFLGLGLALGPIMGGLAAQELGLRAPYLLAILIFIISIFIQGVFLRHFKSRSRKEI